MLRLKLYQFICGLFPPILSQSIRGRIFPIKKAQELKLEFSKTSITGSIFKGNTSDDHSYRFSIHGFFDWRNIIIAHSYTRLHRGDIIEVGANVGTETISYCDLITPKWKVHAFEPLPENLISLNQLALKMKNLIVYSKAISNKLAKMHFEIPPKHESGIGKIINIDSDEVRDNTFEIETLPLDSYLNSFKEVCLISIDTEGHEPFVLDGSTQIIKKFRPAVIIEVSPRLLKKYANSSPGQIQHFFKKKDYSCYSINRLNLKELNDKNLSSGKSQNWFCVPKEKQQIVMSIKQSLFLRAIIPWYFLKPLKSSRFVNL